MTAWTTIRETYTATDRAAFCDPQRINSHFGFPMAYPDRVFSISLNAGRCSNVHEGSKKFRPHYFGNAVAMRRIKTEVPDAWIWDERYHFAHATIPDPLPALAQEEFLRLFGEKNLAAVQSAARAAGVDPRYRTTGRPDIAAFLPGRDPEWRFIEIKIIGGGDALTDEQMKWLEVIANTFGRKSAIELEVAAV